MSTSVAVDATLALAARVQARLLRHHQLLLALVASFGVAVYFRVFALDNFPVDDVYIHLSYGKYFEPAALFSFNGQQPDTGTSSWTWTLLCVVVEQLGLPAHATLAVVQVLVLAALLHRVMAITRFLLPDQDGWRRGLPYLSVALVVANGNIGWLSMCGMEAVAMVALVLAFCQRLCARGRFDGWTGFLALLMIWTRLETIIWLFGAVVSVVALRGVKKRGLLWLLVPAAGIALHLSYNLVVGGQLLPTTAAGKAATFVPSRHDLAAELRFMADVMRNYVQRHLPGWRLQLLVLAIAGADLTRAWLARVLRSRSLGLQGISGRRTLLALLLLSGTAVHTGAYVVSFRTVYHHLRYFAPLLIVTAALVTPCAALSMARLERALRRRGLRRTRPPILWLLRSAAVAATVMSLSWSVQGLPFWQGLYVDNVRQLSAVHFATARWLSSHRSLAPKGVVASFDIGVLRYVTGFRIVDLGGLLDRAALAHRTARANDRHIAAEAAELYISLDNGFDYVPRYSRTHQFGIERIFTRQYPEYYDPFPPHSKRMVVYKVNHCGQPRLARAAVGQPIRFGPGPAEAEPVARRDYRFASLGPAARVKTQRRQDGRVVQPRQRALVSSRHEQQGVGAKGRWLSRPFEVQGQWLSLSIAGGHDMRRLQVQLLAEDESVLHRWTGYRTDSHVEQLFRLDGLRGRLLRLRVIDEATGRWGYLELGQAMQLDYNELDALRCRDAL